MGDLKNVESNYNKTRKTFKPFCSGKKYSTTYHNLPAFLYHGVLLKILLMA